METTNNWKTPTIRRYEEDARDPGWTPPTRKSTARTRIALLAVAVALFAQGATAATHIPRRHLPRVLPITRPHIPRRHIGRVPPPQPTVTVTTAPVPILCSVLPFLSRCAAKP